MKPTTVQRVVSAAAGLIVGLALALAPSKADAQSSSVLMELLSKKNRNVELVAKGGQFLEGPVFDREGNLWVVEVIGGWLSRVEGDKVVRVVQASPDSRPQGLALHQDGRLFVTDRRLGVWTYDPKSKKIDLLIRYFHGQPFKGPNDLMFDNDGNLYFTDAWQTGAEDPTGSLFFAEAAGGYKKITKLIGNLAMPNGVAITPDGGTLYISELRTNRLWNCQLDRTGGGLFSCYATTYFLSGFGPDGLKFDERGNAYVANFNSQGVYVVNQFQEIIEFIRVPSGRWTTNIAFKPGSRWLYITEAQENAVWRVEVDNLGLTPWGLK